MFKSTVSGVPLEDEPLADKEDSGASISLSGQLGKIQTERIKAKAAESKLRKFLYAFKVASRQVRSITARPGIEPSKSEVALIRKDGLDPSVLQRIHDLKQQRMKDAIKALNNQIKDCKICTDQFIKRVKTLANDLPEYPEEMLNEWDSEPVRAKIHEVVSETVSSLWEQGRESEISARFMDFIEFAMRDGGNGSFMDAGRPTSFDSPHVERMLSIHSAYVTIDESLRSVYIDQEDGLIDKETFQLLFGSLSDKDTIIRTEAIMHHVVFIVVDDCMKRVSQSLPGQMNITDNDKSLMFRAMTNYISKDVALCIKHETGILLGMLTLLTDKEKIESKKGQGVFMKWLLERARRRIDYFYPETDSVF